MTATTMDRMGCEKCGHVRYGSGVDCFDDDDDEICSSCGEYYTYPDIQDQYHRNDGDFSGPLRSDNDDEDYLMDEENLQTVMATIVSYSTGALPSGLPRRIVVAPPGWNLGHRIDNYNEEDYDENYDDHYNHYEDHAVNEDDDPYYYEYYAAEEEDDPYYYEDYAAEEEDNQYYYDNGEDDDYREEDDYYDDEDDFKEKRCYGFFKCSSCGQLWESANVFCRIKRDILTPLYKQDCKKCRIGCLPYQVERLRCSRCGETQCTCEKRHVDANKPHRSDLCHRCRSGRLCTQY